MRNRASTHLLILLLIAGLEVVGYVAVYDSALLRGYEPSVVGAARDLLLYVPVIFLLFWLIKAVQFHGFARFCGIPGTFTQHARAYLEGIGVNRFLPFNLGNVFMAKMLAKGLFDDDTKIEYVRQDPAQRIPNINAGRVDIVIQFMTVNPLRAQQVAFSRPYFMEGVALLTARTTVWSRSQSSFLAPISCNCRMQWGHSWPR